MSDKPIKAGSEIVNEFMEDVYNNQDLDETTRTILFHLFKEDNFTRTKIRKALELVREGIFEVEDGNET